ncbi:hypothetical protein, partial [Niallia taxi]|uniref:hypothetical protein n=1 Tax=Niallia taxi TaxID=2499688 RepID=UPI003D2CE109
FNLLFYKISSLLYTKGLFSMQGSGSIFLPFGFATPKKISTLSPLHSEILAVLDCRQADVPKTRNLGNLLARTIVPPKPPVLPNSK